MIFLAMSFSGGLNFQRKKEKKILWKLLPCYFQFFGVDK